MDSKRRLSFRCATLASTAFAMVTLARAASAEPPPDSVFTAPQSERPPSRQELPRAAVREVVFTTNRPQATLETAEPTESGKKRWRPVCYGPCRTELPVGLEYRVAGPGVMASSPFVLLPGEGTFAIDAHPGSKALWVTGVVLTPVGGVATLIGLIGVATAGGCPVEQCEKDQARVDDQRMTAAVFMVAGAAALTAGVLMMGSNRTTLDFDERSGPAIPLSESISLTPRGLVF